MTAEALDGRPWSNGAGAQSLAVPMHGKPLAQRDRDKAYRRTLWLAVLPVIIHILFSEGTDWLTDAAGGLLASVAFLFAANYLHKRPNRFPLIELATLQAYLAWGLSTTYGLTSDAEGMAVFASIVCILAVIVAYPLGALIGRRTETFQKAVLPLRPARPAKWLFWPLLALGTLINAGLAAVVPSEYSGLMVFLFGPHIVQVIADDQDERGASRYRSIGATAVVAMAGFSTGMLDAIMRPVLLYLAFRLVRGRRVPWRGILLFAIAAALLNPVKHEYRQLAWVEGQRQIQSDLTTVMARWVEAMEKTWEKTDEVKDVTSSISSRMDELPIIARTMTYTPGVVPYDYFSGWDQGYLSPVPRFLYPEKPNFTALFNDRFAITFGFVLPSATATATFSMPLVAEGYWGWGWPGIVIVGAVAGFFLGLVSHAFSIARWETATLAAGFFAGARIQACLYAQVGGLMQGLVGTALVVGLVSFISWLPVGAAHEGRLRSS